MTDKKNAAIRPHFLYNQIKAPKNLSHIVPERFFGIPLTCLDRTLGIQGR